MIVSVIDVGTNTVLMVTGTQTADGETRILGDEHAIGRLGQEVDENGKINAEAFKRVAVILREYGEIATGLGADRVVAFGTSALRDARNRKKFIAAMKDQAGIELQLLEGDDEARLTWHGALFGLEPTQSNVVALDIGGGSTEIALGTDGEFVYGASVDIGAVRITERFFRDLLPPSPASVSEARDYVRTAFREAVRLPDQCMIVGVAGTVTTLAAIYGEADETVDIHALNGIALPSEWIRRQCEELLGSGLTEIRAIPQVPSGREDILPGGCLILDEFVKSAGISEIVVSTRGLRYGLLERELAEPPVQ